MARIKKTRDNKLRRDVGSFKREDDLVTQFRDQLVNLDKRKIDSRQKNKASFEWLKGVFVSRLDGKQKVANAPKPGAMFAYIYDAKHKDTLPYWDSLPLIICLNAYTRNGNSYISGLNLHYVPPQVRQRFMESVLRFISTKNLTEKSRIMASWSNLRKLKGAEHMFKTYLVSQMKSKVIEIPPTQWAQAVYLPLAKFHTSKGRVNIQTVWKGNR
jgi:hypothetical protein